MKYNFREALLGDKFRPEKTKEILSLIEDSISFTILGIPGVGVSFLLRNLASRAPYNFIYADMYALSSLNKIEYLKLLLKELGAKRIPKTEGEMFTLCQHQLKKLAGGGQKIVLIFNRFDQLTHEFDFNFFASIRSLRTVSPEKTVMIFTSNKPFYEIAGDSISGTNLNFFSRYIYFGRYSDDDLLKLASISVQLRSAESEIDEKELKKLLKLSGGHNQLFQILLKSEKKHNPLLDHFVNLQLKELYEFPNYKQRRTLQKIALGKNPASVDEYLTKVGLVVKTENGGYRLFTPLLSDYIKSNAPLKLPAKEAKLFRLLKRHLGEIISKEEIFDHVWGITSGEATDWALNALIYRMRKNPVFNSSGYVIESHKKQGYSLIRG